VPDSADDLTYRRECLRLASDFMQLSRDAIDPELQQHCARMAAYWTDRAAAGPQAEFPCSDDSDR